MHQINGVMAMYFCSACGACKAQHEVDQNSRDGLCDLSHFLTQMQ